MGEFPMPGLGDLRDKYTSLGAELANVACLAGMFPPSPPRNSPRLSIFIKGGSVAEWLACWTQAQKGLGSNRNRNTVG